MTKSKKNILFVSVVVLILGILIVYSYLNSRSLGIPDGSIGNTAGNLNNGGYFCENGGRVYFANSYDSGSLYSMKPDKTDIKKLNDLSVKFINAGGDYVFFYGETADSSTGLGSIVAKPSMFMLQSNGKKLKSLSKNVTQDMLLVGDRIYYQNYTESAGTTFRVMDVKKHDSTELLSYMVNPSCYYAGRFYYNGLYTDHYLYAYDTASNTETEIVPIDMWDPVYDGTYVYYMDIKNNYRLCRYSVSSNEIEVLTSDRLDSFNKYGDLIFYQKSSATAPGLYRMNSDGSNLTLIAEGIFNNISVTSTYVYFSDFLNPVITYSAPTYGSPYVTEFTEAKDAVLSSIK